MIVLSKPKRSRKAGTAKVRSAADARILPLTRVRKSDGTATLKYTLDTNSRTFDDDLDVVFKRNVAKARRENKKLFGSEDGPASARR
jgi:hypothetical protein